MEFNTEFSCPICSELCGFAVESLCCGHAFCEECARTTEYKKINCPSCNYFPFEYKESKLARRIISGIRVPCPNSGCKTLIPNKDLPQHLLQCSDSEISCRICALKTTMKDIVSHTLDKHADYSTKIMIDYTNPQTSSKISNLGPTFNSQSTVIDPATKSINRAGRESFIGNTGKFYCEGPLIYPCDCCDGNCGLENGENCLGCMELDVKMRTLPRGYLVNSKGLICRVDLRRMEVYCGAEQEGEERMGACTRRNCCYHCNILKSTWRRYTTLLEEPIYAD